MENLTSIDLIILGSSTPSLIDGLPDKLKILYAATADKINEEIKRRDPEEIIAAIEDIRTAEPALAASLGEFVQAMRFVANLKRAYNRL